MDYCYIYIGYYFLNNNQDPILLCVSDNRDIVKYYLKTIRGLSKSEIDIRQVILDNESAYSLYEDYMLEEYSESILYLTIRDIYSLTHEVDNTISNLEDIYYKVIDYRDVISKVSSLYEDTNSINICLKTMEKELTKVKTMRKIALSVIESSIILSKNIWEYLNYIGYLTEDKELTELFYNKLADDKA